jgi:hypothetical protein
MEEGNVYRHLTCPQRSNRRTNSSKSIKLV